MGLGLVLRSVFIAGYVPHPETTAGSGSQFPNMRKFDDIPRALLINVPVNFYHLYYITHEDTVPGEYGELATNTRPKEFGPALRESQQKYGNFVL
jgi:hypothetical protein